MSDDGEHETVRNFQHEIDEIVERLRYGHVGYDPTMQFFGFSHLKGEAKEMSEMFARLALHLCRTMPGNTMREIVLLKLLEAKDAAVRSTMQVTTNRLR